MMQEGARLSLLHQQWKGGKSDFKYTRVGVIEGFGSETLKERKYCHEIRSNENKYHASNQSYDSHCMGMMYVIKVICIIEEFTELENEILQRIYE